MATEIGIDLGSSKTVLFSSSKIVFEKPSAVTVDSETWEPVFFGDKAKQTLGRTPETYECVYPIKHGVIADYDLALSMLTNYISETFGSKVVRPQIIATLPTSLTELQHHSLANVIEESGGRNVSVLEVPLAIAYGLNLDFSTPKGHMIVDIGAGVTDIAVLSLGGIAQCDCFKTGSFDFDEQIIRIARKKHNIVIGPLTAENIKKQIGAAVKRPLEIVMVARGRNVFTGMPESFEITSGDVYSAIIGTAYSICNAIRKVLEKTDPDLVADIMETGIYLWGGGALLYGMKDLISSYIGAPVHLAEDPEHSVVKGAVAALKKPELLSSNDYQFRSIKELVIE